LLDIVAVLKAEIEKLPVLSVAGVALAEFACSLFPGTELRAAANNRYVSRPHNFVTLTVHYQNARNITVTIRGNPFEFYEFDELPLVRDRSGYSTFKLTKVQQLAAALFYVRRAAELFERGRSRAQKVQRVVETYPE
jgi:hypothetical protein